MLLPEFENAQYIGATLNFKEYYKYISKIILKYALIIALFFAVFSITLFFFKLIVPEINKMDGFNSLSVGAALVTFFSAMISLLSLADSECMKKYESNLQILESRYLDNQKISGWNFLLRHSYNLNGINYHITSAFFTLYANDDSSDKFKIVIPALSIDFHDTHCIKEIYRLKKFMPKFLKYILEKDSTFTDSSDAGKLSKDTPIYYITLPNHISSLYQNILAHKLIKCAIMFCMLFLICATILTVIYPLIAPIIM